MTDNDVMGEEKQRMIERLCRLRADADSAIESITRPIFN